MRSDRRPDTVLRLSTPAPKFGDIFSGSCGLGASGESLEEGREGLPREAPLERLGRGLIVILEGEQPVLECGEGVEIVRREDLLLDDGEVDLNLIEPAGMVWMCAPRSDWATGGRGAAGSASRGGSCRCRPPRTLWGMSRALLRIEQRRRLKTV